MIAAFLGARFRNVRFDGIAGLPTAECPIDPEHTVFFGVDEVTNLGCNGGHTAEDIDRAAPWLSICCPHHDCCLVHFSLRAERTGCDVERWEQSRAETATP